jgi:hypothetical protein
MVKNQKTTHGVIIMQVNTDSIKNFLLRSKKLSKHSRHYLTGLISFQEINECNGRRLLMQQRTAWAKIVQSVKIHNGSDKIDPFMIDINTVNLQSLNTINDYTSVILVGVSDISIDGVIFEKLPLLEENENPVKNSNICSAVLYSHKQCIQIKSEYIKSVFNFTDSKNTSLSNIIVDNNNVYAINGQIACKQSVKDVDYIANGVFIIPHWVKDLLPNKGGTLRIGCIDKTYNTFQSINWLGEEICFVEMYGWCIFFKKEEIPLPPIKDFFNNILKDLSNGIKLDQEFKKQILLLIKRAKSKKKQNMEVSLARRTITFTIDNYIYTHTCSIEEEQEKEHELKLLTSISDIEMLVKQLNGNDIYMYRHNNMIVFDDNIRHSLLI